MRGSEDRNSRIFLCSWSKRVHQARECLSKMLNLLLTIVVHPDDLCLWLEFIMIISLKSLDKFLQITSSACFLHPLSNYIYHIIVTSNQICNKKFIIFLKMLKTSKGEKYTTSHSIASPIRICFFGRLRVA